MHVMYFTIPLELSGYQKTDGGLKELGLQTAETHFQDNRICKNLLPEEKLGAKPVPSL